MTDVWRARALRYTLLYLLLATTLIGVRYQTRDLRPDLLDLQNRKAELTQTKLALELELQSLTASARVRQWAMGGNMTPFSRVRVESGEFEPLPDPEALPLAGGVEVKTIWK